MLKSGRFLASASLVLTVPLLVVTTPSASDATASGPSGVSAGARGSWGAEEVVGDTVVADQEQPALVRVRAGGSAVAAWVAASYDADGPLMVARRRANGHWTVPLAVSPPVVEQTSFDLGIGPTGSASVVWQQRVGDRWRVKESHLRSGAWTAAHALGTGTGPRTTIDGRGTTTVVWSGHGIRSARRSHTGPWHSVPVTRSGAARLLRVSSNADGDVVVAWLHGALVSSSVRPHGARWAGARTWRPDRRDHPVLSGLQSAIGAEGRALVVWSATGVWKEAQHEYANYLAWSRSTGAGTWAPVRLITRSLGEDGGDLSLSMNASGAAVAAWVQIHRSDSPTFAWAARFRPNGTWSAPGRITSGSADWPVAWMDRRGTAHVIVETGWGRMRAFRQSSRSWSTGTLVAKGRLADAAGQGSCLIVPYGPQSNDSLRAVLWTSTR
jgi:hypothetical protein